MSPAPLGVVVPTLATDMTRIPEYARLADEAGLGSIWAYEMYRSPFTMLTAAALSTKSALLGTGIATALTRSPFVAANAIADVDDFSGGRALLGLATGGPELLSSFHSVDPSKPLSKLREYIDVVRVAWEYLHTGSADQYEGKYYRFSNLLGNPFGGRRLRREQVPIYVAAMGPKLTELAGEKGDGWIGSLLATPEFIDKQTRPWLQAGAARVGRDASKIDLCVMVVCSVSPDRDEAIRRAKIQTGLYLAHPVSTAAATLLGFEHEQQAIQQAVMGGTPLQEAVPESIVEAFAIAGTPQEALEKLRAWQAAAPDVHVVLETPTFPPLSADDSEDCYRNIVETFAAPS